MERMAEAAPDSDDHVLQTFLTHSSWDYRAVMDQVARNANALARSAKAIASVRWMRDCICLRSGPRTRHAARRQIFLMPSRCIGNRRFAYANASLLWQRRRRAAGYTK